MWRRSIRLSLREPLGEGEQGRVFEGLRIDAATGLRQTVAVKILHSETEVELWRQEFSSLSNVRSPYCVRVLSFERIRGRPALVLEFVRGLTLAEWHRAGLGGPNEAREILAQVHAGLRDLRACGSFHGDLSPNNVMIDDRGVIRLLDFGLANGTGTRTRCTPEFAAPERLRGDPPTYAGDLYSLGCLEAYLLGAPGDASLLDHDPARRTPPAEAPDADRARHVSALVQSWLIAGSGLRPLLTRGLPRASRRLSIRGAAALLIFLLLDVPALPSQARPGFGTLAISSNAWRQFWLNGHPVGYAPVTLPVGSGEDHRLEWLDARGTGTKRVRVNAGERRRLGDRDFSH